MSKKSFKYKRASIYGAPAVSQVLDVYYLVESSKQPHFVDQETEVQ